MTQLCLTTHISQVLTHTKRMTQFRVYCTSTLFITIGRHTAFRRVFTEVWTFKSTRYLNTQLTRRSRHATVAEQCHDFLKRYLHHFAFLTSSRCTHIPVNCPNYRASCSRVWSDTCTRSSATSRVATTIWLWLDKLLLKSRSTVNVLWLSSI